MKLVIIKLNEIKKYVINKLFIHSSGNNQANKSYRVHMVNKLDELEKSLMRNILGIGLNLSKSYLNKGISNGESWIVDNAMETIFLTKYSNNKFLKEFVQK